MNIDLFGRKNLVRRKCDMCGAELMRRPEMQRETAFCNIVCRNAYKRGGIYITSEFIDEVVSLKKDGWSVIEIADYFEVNRSLIYKVLRGDW